GGGGGRGGGGGAGSGGGAGGEPYLLAVLERDEFTPTRMPLLAAGQVRFAGEPVAMVIADDPYAAEDAAEAVDTEWRPLPAITDIAGARDPGARPVHPGPAGNSLAAPTMFDDRRRP